MSNPNFGVMGPFDPSTENWISYEERFRLHLAANEVTSDEKKQAIFLTTCGTSTYNLLRSFAAAKKPPELRFRRARQARSWTLSPEAITGRPALQIVFALSPTLENLSPHSLQNSRRLSEHCNFGDALQDMLRDRLVCGVHDQRTQRRLLAEPDLTLQKAFEVAQAIESAESQVKELQQPGRAEVHAVKPPHLPFRTTARAETTRRPSPTHRSSTSPSTLHEDTSRASFRTVTAPACSTASNTVP